MSYHIIDHDLPQQTLAQIADAAHLLAAVNPEMLTERGHSGMFRLLMEISEAAEQLEAQNRLRRGVKS